MMCSWYRCVSSLFYQFTHLSANLSTNVVVPQISVWIICQLCFGREDSNCDLIIARWPHFLHPVSPPRLQLVSVVIPIQIGHLVNPNLKSAASSVPQPWVFWCRKPKNSNSHGHSFYFKAHVWRGAHQFPQNESWQGHDGHNYTQNVTGLPSEYFDQILWKASPSAELVQSYPQMKNNFDLSRGQLIWISAGCK